MDFIFRLAEEFLKKHKKIARYRRVFAFIAAIVVFATTYELILPAITMDRRRAAETPGVEVGIAADSFDEPADTEADFEDTSSGEDFQEEEESSGGDAADEVREDESSSESYDADEFDESDESGNDSAASSVDNSNDVPEDTGSENEGDNTFDAEGTDAADSDFTDEEQDPDNKKSDEGTDTADAADKEENSGKGSSEAGDGTENAPIDAGVPEGSTEDAAAAVVDGEPIDVTYPATIDYVGQDYTITATYDEKANLPVGVTLNVVEILPDVVYKDENGDPIYPDYEEYYEETLKALEKEKRLEDDQTVATARFFDITFLDKDGNIVEPAAPVSIAVKYRDALSAVDTADTMAVHFDVDEKKNKTKVEVIDTKTEVKKKEIEEISFEAEKFSVYGVIGTEVITGNVLASDGHNYKVTVSYGPEAGIPNGSELKVKEIVDRADSRDSDNRNDSSQYADYISRTESALDENEKVIFARFFDITIVKDGEDVKPERPVDVKIELADELNENVKAVHFGDEVEMLDAALVDSESLDGAVAFEASGFSVYGVVLTETIETTFKTADGKTLKVTVNYNEDAQIPENAVLEVKEISADDEAWMDRSLRLGEVLQEKFGYVVISDVRFLDIKIMVDGEEYEPKAPVDVCIEYMEKFDAAYTYDYADSTLNPEDIELGPKHFVTIHYVDDKTDFLETDITEEEGCIAKSVTRAESFSEYDFVYFTEDTPKNVQSEDTPNLEVTGKTSNGVKTSKTSGASRAAGSIPSHEKNLVNKGDGTYDIHLNVTGEADTVSEVSSVNVVVVYDTSTSMNNSHNYDPYYVNTYLQHNTGQYGTDGNGNFFNLYRRRTYGSGYEQITNNNYSGTVYANANGTLYTGQRYERRRTTRADVAEPVVRSFVNSLYSYQNSADPTNIQTTFITFNGSANPRVTWTTESGDITSYLVGTGANNSYNHTSGFYASGTNWEAALDEVLTQLNSRPDNDPTYVIFITDGAPTQSKTITTVGTQYEQCYIDARDEARQIQQIVNATGGDFYSIYAYGDETDWLATMMYYANNGSEPASGRGTTFSTKGYYNASDTSALSSAIGEIFDAIIDTLGITSVSIEDGTTSEVELSTGGATADLLDVNTDSFRYTLSWNVLSNGDGTYRFSMPNKTTGEDVDYTVSVSGGNVTITWAGGTASYTGKIETGVLTVDWTESTPFYRFAPPAAQFVDPDVFWNLNNLGTLLNGVTYDVAFECYPSQYTLDLIADLKNAPDPDAMYNSLDENIRTYLIKNGNDYTLKTNTSANMTYTDTRQENPQPHTESYTDPQPVNTSAVEEMAVSKKWENALDSQGSQSILLYVTRDGVERYQVTLSGTTNPAWEGKAFVSIGIMTVHNGVVSIKAPGHDFSFEEPEDLTYHWELDVPIVHPMKINGTDTILEQVTGDDIPSEMLEMSAPSMYSNNNGTYYKMDYNGIKYYVADTSAVKLTAVNQRRSTLNVTKTVTGNNAPADAKFQFDMTVKNSNASKGEADDLDSDYWVWFSVDSDPDPDNFAPVIDANLATGDDLHRATNTAGEYTGYYYVKSGTSFTVNLQADWNLRFMNLPTGSTYEITESSTMPDECFEFVNVVGNREYYVYNEGSTEPVTQNEATGTVTGSKIEGTIANTNSVYTATYTNNYDAAAVTVTKQSDISDGTEFEIIATVTENGTAVTSLPTQSDTKVSVVEGHPEQLKIILKSGETATIQLREGQKLSIAENNSAGYTVSYSYKLSADGEVQSGATIDSISDGNAMTVTNTSTRVNVNLKKVEKGKTVPLPGAKFKLYRKNSSGTYASDEQIEYTKENTTLELTDGTLTLLNLPFGDYKLTEVKAPDGYIYLVKDIYFTVNASGSGDIIITTQGQEAFNSDSIGASTEGTMQDTLVIPNTPGEKLPMTGGTGKSPYTLGGIFLAMTAALMYVFRMRRRERRLK